MDSWLLWALISAFLSDFGYLANQTLLLLVQDVYIEITNNECASTIYVPLGKRFYQLGIRGDTERLHACMGRPVYDEEAEVNHRCLITSNLMCLATTAKCETLAEPSCLKIQGS